MGPVFAKFSPFSVKNTGNFGRTGPIKVKPPFQILLLMYCKYVFNPKRIMQKILTLKYMRGPRGPQKHNGITQKISKACNKFRLPDYDNKNCSICQSFAGSARTPHIPFRVNE